MRSVMRKHRMQARMQEAQDGSSLEIGQFPTGKSEN